MLDAILHSHLYLGELIARYGHLAYGLLFLIVFCETAILPLFFLPGGSLLLITGAYCAQGAIQIGIVIPMLVCAAVLGGTLNYRIGMALRWRLQAGTVRWIHPAMLLKTQQFYDRNGGLTLLVAPFVAVVRTFAPFVAGLTGVAFPRFVAFSLAGALLWIGGLVGCGYLASGSAFVHEHLSAIAVAAVAAAAIALGRYRRRCARLP